MKRFCLTAGSWIILFAQEAWGLYTGVISGYKDSVLAMQHLHGISFPLLHTLSHCHEVYLTLSARITYMYVMVHVTGPRITYIYVMRTVKMNVLPRHPWSTDLIPTWTSDVLDERRLFYDGTDGRTCAAMHAY